MGKQWKQCQTLFLGAPKSLQMVIAAMKLKDVGLLGYPIWTEKAEELFFRSNELGFDRSQQRLAELTVDRSQYRKRIKKEVFNQIVAVAPKTKTAEYHNKKSDFISDNPTNAVITNPESTQVKIPSNQPINNVDNTNNVIDQMKPVGNLKPHGNSLAFSDNKLSKEAVQTILSPAEYSRYLTARNYINASTTFAIICGVALGGALDCLLYSAQYHKSTKGLTIGCLAIAGVTFPICWVLDSMGRREMKQVADYYNYREKRYSFNLSPSVLNLETPSMQGNYGLGLTLNMDF